MDKWIEVFRAGRWTDNRGRTRQWTEADLDRMVASYDPANHEAPAVIGHPRDNHPAYGWVEAVRRVGDRLEARFRQIVPEFAEMLKKGLFKKRSISIYPDGRLRHVGFLGAAAPAVQGLKDFTFTGSDDCHEYEEAAGAAASPTSDKESAMTVEDMKKKLEEAEAAKAKAEAEAAKSKAEAEGAKADFAEAQAAARKKAIGAFIDAGIKDGKILPAWKEAGLAEFMGALDEAGGEYEFSEGKKVSAAQWFRDFLASFSAHPLFKQMARPQGEGKAEADFAESDQRAERIAGYVNPSAGQ